MAHLTPITGIRLGSCCAGIKSSPGIPDLAIIEIPSQSTFSCVFTQNSFCAAPVTVAKQHLSASTPRYLLINSGNANAGMGDTGLSDVAECCQILSEQTGCNQEEVIPFSTGVIGERLPVDAFRTAIPEALKNLSADGWLAAAEAILTTDTTTKSATHQVTIDGKTITVTGIAKGSGMICPDMATMLAYMATDAAVSSETLDQCLLDCVNNSFNRITVDGDMSTNDACALIATGAANNSIIATTDIEDYIKFNEAVEQVCLELAKLIIRDGEGATKFITIDVCNGLDDQECKNVADKVANSPLVKTAFFASDPNWGRILAAIGSCDIHDLDISRVSVYLDDVCIVSNGAKHRQYLEADGQEIMGQNEITIRIDLARGNVNTRHWTCDLSYDYVRINAEYRT